MGCTSSKEAKISGESTPKVETRMSATEDKIYQALLKKRMENATNNKVISFEKILLKFDKLRTVLNMVKKIFNELAQDNKLNLDGLKETMKRLSVDLSTSEVADLFDFVDVQESKQVTFKEFLTALTIGMVLEVIPALRSHGPDDDKSKPKPELKRSVSGFMGRTHEVKEMLNLIVNAYLIFDPDGKGYIERDGVEKMLQEQGSKGGNAMLSQHRWNEMDWDSNGTIDFAEFVYSFTSWVDIENPEE
jgi:calcium-binding protein CML